MSGPMPKGTTVTTARKKTRPTKAPPLPRKESRAVSPAIVASAPIMQPRRGRASRPARPAADDGWRQARYPPPPGRAGGEDAGREIGEMGKADAVECFVGREPLAPPEASPEGEILVDREGGLQRVEMAEIVDFLAEPLLRGRIEQNRACGRPHQPGDETEQSRLSRAVRPVHGEKLARG